VLRDLIVLALGRLGGAASRRDALAELNRLYGGVFTAEDRDPVSSRPHEAAWQNRASWERAEMVRDGILAQRSDGIWELDQTGKEYLATIDSLPVQAEPRSGLPEDPLRDFSPKDSSEYLAHLAGRTLVKSRAHETLVREYGNWVINQGFRRVLLSERCVIPGVLVMRRG
jgi:hypothetical protein